MVKPGIERWITLWIVFATLLVLALGWWQAGPVLVLGRWQRATLGTAFPATTLLLLLALLVVPALVLARSGETAVAVDRPAPARWRVLALLAVAALAAALVSLIPLLWAPATTGPEREIDLQHGATLGSGPVAVHGWRPAAGDVRQSGGGGHSARYLPVVPAGAPAGTLASVVIELPDNGLVFDPLALPPVFHGIAQSGALPAAAADELRARGAIGSGTVDVVFTETAAITRPIWRTAFAFLLVALVFAAFAVLAWVRGRPVIARRARATSLM